MIYLDTPTRKDAIIALSRELHHEGCTIRGDGSDIKKITLESGEALKFSSADIDAKLILLIEEFNNLGYARDRQVAYPSVGDQLDMLMKDMRDNTTTHREACSAVKARFPKTE